MLLLNAVNAHRTPEEFLHFVTFSPTLSPISPSPHLPDHPEFLVGGELIAYFAFLCPSFDIPMH